MPPRSPIAADGRRRGGGAGGAQLPGTVIAVGRGVGVRTGDGVLELLTVQPEGKAADGGRGLGERRPPGRRACWARSSRHRGRAMTGAVEQGAAARRVALEVLARVEDDGAYANLVLSPMLERCGLGPTDRGLRDRAGLRHPAAPAVAATTSSTASSTSRTAAGCPPCAAPRRLPAGVPRRHPDLRRGERHGRRGAEALPGLVNAVLRKVDGRAGRVPRRRHGPVVPGLDRGPAASTTWASRTPIAALEAMNQRADRHRPRRRLRPGPRLPVGRRAGGRHAGRDGARPVRRPGRQGHRHGRRRGARWSRPTSSRQRVGLVRTQRRAARCRAASGSWSPTPHRRRSVPARSTGSCWTPRARGSACCAAVPMPGGASSPTSGRPPRGAAAPAAGRGRRPGAARRRARLQRVHRSPRRDRRRRRARRGHAHPALEPLAAARARRGQPSGRGALLLPQARRHRRHVHRSAYRVPGAT